MKIRKPAAAVCLAALFALLAVPVISAAPPIELPALIRIASRLSGLKASSSIKVTVQSATGMKSTTIKLFDRDYPPDQQAYDETIYRALGVLPANKALRPYLLQNIKEGPLGLYDPITRRIYVREGTAQRQSLLHEVVHALQDQAFNLRRLTDLRRGQHDAALSAAAAVEGNATLTTQVLGGRTLAIVQPQSQRTLQSHTGCHICFFLDLENSFAYQTGVQFMATLYGLGGRPAMFTALKVFPQTTEQIFHIDAFLTREKAIPINLPADAAGFTLKRSDTFGELDVRALLATFQVPRLDHVGDGWGGGRSATYTNATGQQSVAFVLAWDTELDAQQWQEAVSTYVNEAFDPDVPGFPVTTPCTSDSCWAVGGRNIALVRRGVQTALVFGPSVDAASPLAVALASTSS